jgi:Copper type II ascorbate-dependent monooxygenase, C-terminal domain
VNDFLIPPHTVGKIGASCGTFGGRVVEMMPHTHKLSQGVTVDRIRLDGTEERVLDQGAFDTASDIKIYEPALALENGDKLRYECTFNNSTDHDVVYGLGENEMCVVFGYISPPWKQFVAFSDKQGDPCQSVQIGLFR